MINIEKFIADGNINKPLLFLGKGPSFDSKDDFVLSNFFTIAANHAVRSAKVDVCSVIDIDVLRDCSDEIYDNCKYLMMPWFPHDPEKGYAVSQENLEGLRKDHPLIDRMIEEGRMIIYNLSSSKEFNKSSKVYATAINSADTLFNMLVSNGVKVMYSLGVDGGTTYSEHFCDLVPLRNMRDSFDEQDPVIEAICKNAGAKFIKLQHQENIEKIMGIDGKEYDAKDYMKL